MRLPGFACLKLGHKYCILPSTCPNYHEGHPLLPAILFLWYGQVIKFWLRFGMAVVRELTLASMAASSLVLM